MASGSGWNLRVWLAGGGCEWNLRVWLVDVVVRRYIDFLIITYPYSSCICSFLQQHPYFLFMFLNVFRSCSGVSATWGPQRNGDPGYISLGFGDHKSPLISSVLGPTLVIMAS